MPSLRGSNQSSSFQLSILPTENVSIHLSSPYTSSPVPTYTESKLTSYVTTQPKKYTSLVHVAMVVTDDMASIHLHTTIKSILILRSTPLHFHFITDDRAKTVLHTIMKTWLVPSVSHDYYNLTNTWLNISKRLNSPATKCSRTHNIHMNLDLVLPESVGLVVVVEPSSVVMTDLARLVSISLTRLDRMMTVCQKKCVQYCSYNRLKIELAMWGLIGINLDLQRKFVQSKSKLSVLQEISCKPHQIDMVDFTSMTQVTCNNTLISDGEPLRHKKMSRDDKLLIEQPPPKEDYCKMFDFERKGQRRELPFLLGHRYNSQGEGDVTLAVHLDYNRLGLLVRVLNHWSGPASVAIHVEDVQILGVLDFLLNSKSLQERTNVSFHLLFKIGPSYPPNHGRQLAHKFVSTPYMFILDVDFFSSSGAYSVLKKELETRAFGNMDKTAVVIPAFETNDKNFEFPPTRSQMVDLFSNHTVDQFHGKSFKPGHTPTDYAKWITAKEPYVITWKRDYEPYYVVKKSVDTFDKQFIARFGDKISHCIQLHMADYKFIVFPDVYIIHLPHSISKQNMDALRKCSKTWYSNWLKEKRNQYHYFKQDIRTNPA